MLAALAVIILAQPPMEIQRLEAHFAEAERVLRSAPALTDDERQARRMALLDELRAYADAGLFPENRGYVHQTPYFVDDDGARCAVAHLLEVTGEEALMERIAATANTAFVPELRDDPELLAWLDEHGLSVADAARIQPSYSYGAYDCVCDEERFDPYFGRVLAVYQVAEVDGALRAKARLAGRDLFAIDEAILGLPDDPSAPRTGSGPWVVAIYEADASEPGAAPSRTLVALPLSTPCPRYVGFTGPPALPSELLARAFFASNARQCRDVLTTADPRWAFETGEDGCAIGRGDPAPGLLVLMLVFSGWVARRLRMGHPRERRSGRRQR